MISDKSTTGKKRFYGWFALVGVMVVSFVVIGSFLTSFGVFLPVICSELGWSRAALSLGLTLGMLCNGLPGPLWGFLVARFGPRPIVVAGGLLAALGLSGMSIVQETWHVYIAYSLAGLGIGLGGMIATATVVNNWFVKKRSLALGMMISCGCLGGFAFPPMVTALISSLGWRASWLVLSGIIFTGASLVGGVLIRNRPEDLGQVPDGEPPSALAGSAELDRPGSEKAAVWRMRQVMRAPTTWLIALFTVSYAIALGTTVTHQIAYLEDLGFNPMVAATTLSMVSGIAIVGSMGFGTLSMRFNIRHMAAGFMSLQLFGLIILLTSRSLTLIYVYAILFGISNGAVLVALPTFVGAYYGRTSYSRVLGTISPFQVVAQAGAATAAGAIFDSTGSYAPAFIFITAFSVVGVACALLARPPVLSRSEAHAYASNS